MRTTSADHTSQSHLWIASALGSHAPSRAVTGVLQKRPLFSNGPPMIDVRIVCTHDAVKLAETLMRLLAAEDHQVRVSYGRHSVEELEAAAAESDAVLLVWSLDAPSAHYMLQWASRIHPDRLIEIARAPNWPRIEGRRSPVIDFSSWRGERGGRAWNALVERLRVVQRTLEPKGPPPRRAAMALGLVSAVAVGGAFIERVHDAFELPAAPQNESIVATAPQAASPNEGMGGPLQAVEPASVEDIALRVHSIGPRAQHLQIPADLVLNEANAIPDITIERERSLLRRIGSVALSLRDAALGDGDAQTAPHQEASIR
jgi:hypothetical protein